MTRAHRTFPFGLRLLAGTCALLAFGWYTPSASAVPPVSSGEVQNADRAYQQLLGKLSAVGAQVDAIQARLSVAVNLVDQQTAELEKTKADVLDTQRQIQDAKDRYDRIRQRLNERAVSTFMSGGVSDLSFILGATSLTDLSDRMEFVNVVTQSDADLAQQVENLRSALSADEARLKVLEEQQSQQLAKLQANQDQIAADLQRVEYLKHSVISDVQHALSRYKTLKGRRAEFLKQQAEQTTMSPTHAPVPLPAQYKDLLQVCPVGTPRFFGDGFGAPRYAGGFHLHAGVDIVTSRGMPIYAPFDGVARSSYNALGGNAVYVTGRYGYVYNAHLDHYSALSNGPVKAGDVIGYVGDTGDAIGTPHDHFEFHPFFPVPADWPVSYYGYRVIGTAVNPYPLLVATCG